MKKLLSLLAISLIALASQAQASGELDNESQVKNAQRFASELPQTLVVRQDQAGSVAVFHSAEKIAPGTALNTAGLRFEAVANTAPPSELDQNSSSSGWYFWWNYSYSYSAPTYYYYNYAYAYAYSYSYNPYYSYYNYYDNCRYSYYGWGW